MNLNRNVPTPHLTQTANHNVAFEPTIIFIGKYSIDHDPGQISQKVKTSILFFCIRMFYPSYAKANFSIVKANVFSSTTLKFKFDVEFEYTNVHSNIVNDSK